MLRAVTKRAILELLDDSYFGISNFSTEFSDGNPLWLKVVFIPTPSFNLTIETASNKSTSNSLLNFTGLRYQISAAPGTEFLKPDIHFHQTFDECAARIPGWIKRVKEEVIDSSPLNRELQDIRKQLEDRLDKLAEKQDEFFTREESDELISKLAKLSSQLAELLATNDELKQAVADMQAKLTELGSASENLNKATWYRMAGSRLLRVAKTVLGSKEGREFALEAAKKVLLEGPR